MTHLAEALNIALLHFVWQGIVGGVVWGVVLLALRKSSADSRYVAGCVLLAALGLAPVITFAVAWQTATIPLQPSVDGSGSLSTFAVSTMPGPSPAALGSLESWILPLWAAGVLVFTLRLAWAGGHASSLRRHAVKADSSMDSMVAGLAERLGVRRKLCVLMSSIAEVPSVVGWIRPVILLPAAVVVGLTPQQLESLLAHELAHIRRHDYFVNILQMIVETFLFYHPVVWWVSSRIRYERELCCDDLAVRSCGDAVSYARALAQLERLRLVAPSLAMGSANGPLLHRIQRLLGHGRYEQVPSRLACAAGLLVGFLCLGWFMTAKAEQREALPEVKELMPILEEVTPAPPIPPRPPTPPAVVARTAPPVLALPPLAPIAPVQALPAAPAVTPFPVLPVPPVPPTPPTSPTSPMALLSLLQLVSQSQESHWVLFRGNSILVRGSSADEEQAKKARATVTGDLLWFQLDGNAFITQDKEVMDRIQGAGAGTPEVKLEIELRRQLEQLEAEQRRVTDQRRDIQELQISLEELNRSLADIPVGVSALHPDRLRLQAIRLRELNAQMEVMAAKRESDLRAMEREMAARRNAEQGALRDVEILRRAVQEGKAHIVP